MIIGEPAGAGMVHEEAARAAFESFVGEEGFPCLAAKGAVRREEVTLRVYDRLGAAREVARLAADLERFVSETPADGAGLRTFVAVFPADPPDDELAFERRLWRALQRLHEHDAPLSEWDPTVSADPESTQFSFSFGGRALFVVGLHPASSRLARQFRWPALVFNPRAQFERFRAEGKYDRLRTAVRERDVALQGTANPNLADFGERSEASQYSGRATEAGWRCPFHHTDP